MHNNETFRVDFRPNFSQEHLKNVLETALIYCGYWGRWQDGRWEEVFEAPSNCSTKGIDRRK